MRKKLMEEAKTVGNVTQQCLNIFVRSASILPRLKRARFIVKSVAYVGSTAINHFIVTCATSAWTKGCRVNTSAAQTLDTTSAAFV